MNNPMRQGLILQPKAKSLQDQMLMRCNRILSDAEFLSVYAVSVAHIESENLRLTADNETLKKTVLAFAAEHPPAASPVDLTEWVSARLDAARYRIIRSHYMTIELSKSPVQGGVEVTVSYTHLTLPTNRE